jgi:hypothetical protein
MIKKLILVLISFWLGGTALIDFAVVPTVFRTINDFFNAGELGIALFGKFNSIELLIASTLFLLSLKTFQRSKRNIIQLSLVVLALAIVLIYFSYLTPKLTSLTELWKKADALNSVSISGISDIQQEHQFYHRIYVMIDTVKLIILSTLLVLSLTNKEDQRG